MVYVALNGPHHIVDGHLYLCQLVTYVEAVFLHHHLDIMLHGALHETLGTRVAGDGGEFQQQGSYHQHSQADVLFQKVSHPVA